MHVELDVPATMRDGVVLRADVYRPSGTGPWPVLVHRTPYGKRANGAHLNLNALEATMRGYMVVQQDTRGRFASDGEWVPWKHEREDGFDTIEWAARLPGSDGNVATVGQSYTGSTQWSAAVMQPPSLRAMAPMLTWSDPDDGLMFRGGAVELGLNAWWTLSQSLAQYPKLTDSGDGGAALTAATIRDWDELADAGYWELPSGFLPAIARTTQPDIGVARALADPETSDESRVVGRHDRVEVPTLNVAGWYDVFQQGSLDNYVAMRRRGIATRLVVGPWTHTTIYGLSAGQIGAANFGARAAAPAGSASVTAMQLDWFDQWMKRSDPDIPRRSAVTIFVMGINEWRDEDDWPLSRAVDTPLYLHADGVLGFDEPSTVDDSSSYAYDPSLPVLTRGGAQLLASEFPPGPADQATTESREDVLVFTGAPLAEDFEVTGRVRAVLFVSSDAPSTDWVVRLCDVDASGRSLNVVDGILRHVSANAGVQEIEVDLWSTSMVFRAGHRLRVQVTSSNFPRWDRNPNTGESTASAVRLVTAKQVVRHDAQFPSRLILPVVP